MSCIITSGISKSCEFAMGGLKKLYVANLSQVSGFTDSNVDGVYDTVTMNASGNTFYQIEFEKNTAVSTNDLTVSNGQKFWTHSVTASVSKNDQPAIDFFEALALGSFIAIAETRNSKRYVLGRVNGLEASVMTNGSGTAEGDFSGWVFTLTGAEKESAQEFAYTASIPV